MTAPHVEFNDTDWVECWLGQNVYHLFPTCPLLRRHSPHLRRASTVVDPGDPFGVCLCGWCLRVWKARRR